MAGKHERPRPSRTRWAAVSGGAAVTGLLLAAVTWVFLNAWSNANDAADSAAPTVSTRSTPATSPTSTTTSASTTTTTSSTPSSATSTAEQALAKAQGALATCRAHVVAGEGLARAAAASARDWTTHTGAQLKLESGAWTLAQANAAWAASKARGPTDLKQFAAAAAAVRAAGSGSACSTVVTDTAPTELAGQGRQCAARDRALAAVASTGAVVNGQWAAHIALMADKPHTEAGAYRDRWLAQVGQAQAPLERYAAAATALAKAPTCSG